MIEQIIGPVSSLEQILPSKLPPIGSPCQELNCGHPVRSRGLCSAHLKLKKASNSLRKVSTACVVVGCGSGTTTRRGLCMYHYQKLRASLMNQRIRELSRDYYHRHKTNPDFIAKRKVNARKTNNTESCRYKGCVRRSKQRGLEWGLSLQEFSEITARPCLYCGDNQESKVGWLDRKNNTLGYTIDNSAPCCGKCNKLKGNILSYEETVAVVNLLREMRGGKVW